MAVNKTINLSWGGKTYPLIVTMRHIDQIEEEINLMKMVSRCATGDIRFSHAAKLISILLNIAGAEATQEDVYDGMFSDEGIDPNDIVEMVSEILDVVFYRTKKKPIATPKKKVRKSPARSKATRGKKSTK